MKQIVNILKQSGKTVAWEYSGFFREDNVVSQSSVRESKSFRNDRFRKNTVAGKGNSFENNKKDFEKKDDPFVVDWQLNKPFCIHTIF
jgi:hypothetical protein